MKSLVGQLVISIADLATRSSSTTIPSSSGNMQFDYCKCTPVVSICFDCCNR